MKIQICSLSSPISNIWYINFTVQISKQALLLDVSHSNKRSHYDRVCFDSDGSGGLMSILNEYVNICSTMYHHSTSVCSAPCLLLRADVLCISLCFGLHLQFVCNHDNTQKLKIMKTCLTRNWKPRNFLYDATEYDEMDDDESVKI